MRVATFNVQNMRLRMRDGVPQLDGAEDRDDRTRVIPGLDRMDRRLTAAVLREIDADVVALQEVFDQETLDFFHDRYLTVDGFRPYPERICLPGNDGRGLDVAVMSRLPLQDVRSHADVTRRALGLEGGEKPDAPALRRDCLMVTVQGVTLVICHFKAPYPDPVAAWTTRREEAEVVRHLIDTRFGDDALWLILGDLNEPDPEGHAAAIAPLLPPFSIDLLDRLAPTDRWTYFNADTNRPSRPDAMLASPALAGRFPAARPQVQRIGMARDVPATEAERLAPVGWHRPHASDHAALWVDFDAL